VVCFVNTSTQDSDLSRWMALYSFRTTGANYIEDITRWREDINFMFEWQEQYQEQKQKAGIVTSLNDTTLTKVTRKIRHSGPG